MHSGRPGATTTHHHPHHSVVRARTIMMMAPPTTRVVQCLAAAIVATVLLLRLAPFPSARAVADPMRGLATRTGAAATTTPPHGRHAFCVFLNEPDEPLKDGEEDHYFVGTRMLIYQLLHDPDTRTDTAADVVVLVPRGFAATKRARLTRDGAKVIAVDEIAIDWIVPHRRRWAHVMDKLRAWTLTQYDKVLLLDGDTVVVRRLDPLFAQHDVRPNAGNISHIRPDEAAQPARYLFAGNGGPSSPQHAYPAPRGERCNAGFVLFKPDRAMFDYYLSIARIAHRFQPHSPEQNLWNYAHARAGNMPWIQIDPAWTMSNPTFDDYRHGVAALHEKYWRCARDRKLQDILLRSRWKMEGFFEAYDP